MRCLFLVGAIASLLLVSCQVNEQLTEPSVDLFLLRGDLENGECSYPHPFEFKGGQSAIETFASLEIGDSIELLPQNNLDKIGEVYIGDETYFSYEYAFSHPDTEGEMYAIAQTLDDKISRTVDYISVGTRDTSCRWQID